MIRIVVVEDDPEMLAARGQAPGLLALAHTVHEQRDSLFQALSRGYV